MKKKKLRKLQARCLFFIYEGMKTQLSVLNSRTGLCREETGALNVLRYWENKLEAAVYTPKEYLRQFEENKK